MQTLRGLCVITTACLVSWSGGPVRATLVAHYEFDEVSGTIVSDTAGTSDGTAANVSFVASTAGVSGSGLGNAGGFNGFSSEVTLGEPAAFDLGDGDFTIAGWLKAPTNFESGVFGNRSVFQNIDYAGGGWNFELGRADRSYRGKVFFTVGGGSSSVFSQTQVFTDVRIDDDAWHWIAVTNSGGALSMYVDGLLQVDTGILVDGTSTATSPEGTIAQFGARGLAQQLFEGSLDDWRIYDEAVSGTLDGSNYLVSGALYDVWQAGASPILPGDLDHDGFVGLNDLDIILGAWNQSVPPADPAADPTNDGFVGLDDLDIVLGNWNAGTAPVSSVPEPASLALLGLAGLPILHRRK